MGSCRAAPRSPLYCSLQQLRLRTCLLVAQQDNLCRPDASALKALFHSLGALALFHGSLGTSVEIVFVLPLTLALLDNPRNQPGSSGTLRVLIHPIRVDGCCRQDNPHINVLRGCSESVLTTKACKDLALLPWPGNTKLSRRRPLGLLNATQADSYPCMIRRTRSHSFNSSGLP